jgi:hypothetical protein
MTHLEKNFEKFDRENPAIWKLFEEFAKQCACAGHVTLSASLITERIRWETTVVTRSDDGFKICNNHRAYYARKWNLMYMGTPMPIFRTRAVLGERGFLDDESYPI